MSKREYHTFSTQIPHHEGGGISVDIEHCGRTEQIKISLRKSEGGGDCLTLTLDECIEVVGLGGRFEAAHKSMANFTQNGKG